MGRYLNKFFSYSVLLACISAGGHPYDAIINLGGDCQISYQLYITGLRKYALPFDSLITPYASLKALLKNDFVGFMSPENFELVTDEKGEKYVLDKKYGTRWLHDFKIEQDFLKDYEDIAAKYVRRIDRLVQLIVSSEYPLFMRKRITKEQAIELRDVLRTIRGAHPFLLVVLDGTPEMEADWQEEQIKNYYLRQPKPYSWKGDCQAWREIFDALELEVSGAHASSSER